MQNFRGNFVSQEVIFICQNSSVDSSFLLSTDSDRTRYITSVRWRRCRMVLRESEQHWRWLNSYETSSISLGKQVLEKVHPSCEVKEMHWGSRFWRRLGEGHFSDIVTRPPGAEFVIVDCSEHDPNNWFFFNCFRRTSHHRCAVFLSAYQLLDILWRQIRLNYSGKLMLGVSNRTSVSRT